MIMVWSWPDQSMEAIFSQPGSLNVKKGAKSEGIGKFKNYDTYYLWILHLWKRNIQIYASIQISFPPVLSISVIHAWEK